MSHFEVLIFTKEDPALDVLERILAPYDESIEVEPYVYMKKDEAIKKLTDYIEQNPEKKEIYQNLSYKDAVKEYFWKNINEDGDLITTYNPDSKWDWWEVGGRFDCLKTLNGSNLLTQKVSNVNWNPYDAKNSEHFWEVVVEGKDSTEKEDFKTFYNKDYYLELFKDKETFVEINSFDLPFAYVDLEGEWHEQGKMLYFGLSNSNNQMLINYYKEFKNYLKNNQNAYVTVVDCHI